MNIEYGKPKKLSCMEAIYVTFDYDIDKINTIRAYPDRYYHAKTKTWEMPIEAVPYLEKRLDINFLNEPPKIEKKETQVYEIPKLKTELYNFQKEDYQVLMNHDKYLLLNSQGAGKSACAMSVALGRQKYNNIDHCLVIVGVNGSSTVDIKGGSIHLNSPTPAQPPSNAISSSALRAYWTTRVPEHEPW